MKTIIIGGGISGAVQNHAVTKKAIPAPEIMTLWTTPKTLTTPLSLSSSRMREKRVRSTPTSSPITGIRKIVTIYRPPRRMLASVTKISSCLKSLPNKNALSVS